MADGENVMTVAVSPAMKPRPRREPGALGTFLDKSVYRPADFARAIADWAKIFGQDFINITDVLKRIVVDGEPVVQVG